MSGEGVLNSSSVADAAAALEMDSRQREAACLLMAAVDFPAPMHEASVLILEAAKLCPGITVDRVPIGQRILCLQRARQLIDDMLAEHSRAPEIGDAQ